MVRTRFAPSPTGSLHVGGVRTALYCLLYARRHGGTFVLRIEDTDQARSTEEAAQGILRDLRWCGLQWDEGPDRDGGHGPYHQSRRLAIYDQHTEALLASGKAYLAWDRVEELEEKRKAAQVKKETFRYRGGPVDAATEARYRAEGRVPVVRLTAPARAVTVDDAILGPVTVPESDLEDVVIRKADGFPTYHFAVVIDDALMEITQILRGQEHLLNTHKHVGIAEALGWELPTVGHLPLIFNPAGQKMSKREKAAAAREAAKKEHKQRGTADYGWLAALTGLGEHELVAFMKKENDRIVVSEAIGKALGLELPMIEVMDFRRGGYVPEALINYMALLGWNPGDEREILSVDEMAAAFSLERVNKTAAKFDPAKLLWMNGEYIRRMHANAPDRLLAVVEQWLEVVSSPIAGLGRAQRLALIGMYKDRAQTLAEIDRTARFFFVRPLAYDAKAVAKWLGADGIAALRACAEALATAEWTVAGVEAALTPVAGGEVGKVAQPLRTALTGTAVSPPIFDTLAFFTREEALDRIRVCLAAHGSAG